MFIIADAKIKPTIFFCLGLDSSATQNIDVPNTSGMTPNRTSIDSERGVDISWKLQETPQIRARREQKVPSMKTTEVAYSLTIDHGNFFPEITIRTTLKA